MWLLDINVPAQVGPVLRELGVSYKFAANQGWGVLTNGALVEAANKAAFTCILTKDARFDESAKASLKRFPELAIVRLALAQSPGRQYAEAFRTAWLAKPIAAVPGKLIIWPALEQAP